LRYSSGPFQRRLNTLTKSLAASGALYTLVAFTGFVLEALKSPSAYIATAVSVPVVGIAFNLIITRSSKAFRTSEVELGGGHLPSRMTFGCSETLEIGPMSEIPSVSYEISKIERFQSKNCQQENTNHLLIISGEVGSKEEVKRCMM
jgi:hypothetical protein